MSFTGPSLRDRLRTGTRTSQDALERARRHFDLNAPPAFARFLCAQHQALTVLRGGAPELQDALDAGLDLLAQDFADLGLTPPARKLTAPQTGDAHGRGYVWHSQKIGLRMIARNLEETSDLPRRFLDQPRDMTAWRSLCDRLEQMPGYGPEGDGALTAANDWLALFETIHLEHARAKA